MTRTTPDPPALPFDQPGLDIARAEVRESSFYHAFSLLDPEGRADLEQFYIFCRIVDNLADEPREMIDPRQHLAHWEWFFSNGFTSPPGWEGAAFPRSLAGLSRRHGIPAGLYLEIVSGMQSDLELVRIPDEKALARYCFQAAGAVGRICIPIFGGDLALLSPYADRLGEAFQLTNILRDLRSDAERNRIYLPADRMAHHGVTEEEVLSGRMTPAMKALLLEIWLRSEEQYRVADALLNNPEDRKTMVAARAMERVYHALHRKIRKKGFDVYTRKVRLNPFEKLSVAVGFWLDNLSRKATSA